ncbi:E3 SUMO-protein ligase RanBP2 [Cylas formicarius]|uniref:E3 SUMO-protein ligase RanBP2 n=1 Tax=Cylas formicarius TaxID=197179 RepID=UPI00295833BF|nr:E3 SUMO-protein ligase RanBP2 [Cylas formicarius]
MFRTKLEVDKHVDNSLKKINNETERNLRCFAFAKLYFSVGDYEQTVRYVSSYLSVKPKSPEGYGLLGNALEKLGRKEAALEAYKKSLQQEPKQNNLIMKVCQLMAEDDVELDQSGARYFCELAQTLDPRDPAIFTLKERLVACESDDPREVTRFLLAELENRPGDVALRVRLMRHYLRNDMIAEAYEHAADVEERQLGDFHASPAWYDAVAEVLVRYERRAASPPLSWHFWHLSVSVLDKMAGFALDEHSPTSTTDYAECVFNFDQVLARATGDAEAACPDPTFRRLFLDHYEAQLHFHLAVLAFRQAKKGLVGFKECADSCLPVWLVAYHCPPPDLDGVWFAAAPENTRRTVCRWHRDASFRCSQSGHVVLGCAPKNRRGALMEKASRRCATGASWRERFFKSVFAGSQRQRKAATSFFVARSAVEPTLRLPDAVDLERYDSTAQTARPASLHHYVWLLKANEEDPTAFRLTTFDGLPYGTRNPTHCSAESLSVVDVEAFLYCAAMCADDAPQPYERDRPRVMPAAVTAALGTPDQAKFVEAAHAMGGAAGGGPVAGDARRLLMKGIEVVRCVGNHGLDVAMLVRLGDAFARRAEKRAKRSEAEANEARAELYWNAALPLLERLKKQRAVSYPPCRLFEYRGREMAAAEVAAQIERANLFVGEQLAKRKEFERACAIFETLRDPYASFHQARIYVKMADELTDEDGAATRALLTRARDCLYLTLDRLRDPLCDRDHPLNARLAAEIDETERKLARLDPDGRSDDDDDDDGAERSPVYVDARASFRTQSTPLSRREARPSPERLDAQLRQMAAARDAVVGGLVEQNKTVAELQRGLLEEFRGFKDAVKRLSGAVDEQARTFRECLDDLKQNVGDVVRELKLEIRELKKDQQKNTVQLSDEDLFGLDLDYNVNPQPQPPPPPLLYPSPYHARMPPPPAAALYPSLYPGLAYAYGGLGLPPPFLAAPEQQLQQLTALTQLAPPPPPPATLAPQSPKPFATGRAPPPVNVVITSSDPLPAATAASAVAKPVLSVTIPPQHIKQPHGYQIPMPTTTSTLAAPAVLREPPPAIATQSLLTNVAPPPISAVTPPSKNVTLGVQIEKTLDRTFSPAKEADPTDAEYDPRPDFKPIVPLPAEVPVTTGEENETELFRGRAKLFRLVADGTASEWKERGVGTLKILFDPETGKVRLIMRREQVHKVCANHMIVETTTVTPMGGNERACVWAAHDYADGAVVLEKFCAKFKTAEEAVDFRAAFDLAKSKIRPAADSPKKSLGGFVFTAPVAVKEGVEKKKEEETEPPPPSKPSPFANFSFGDAFKPKAGSWECRNCYIVNGAEASKCPACDSPRSPVAGFGDAFKPKAGSWECAQCLVRNDATNARCLSCDHSKEGGAPAPTPKGVDLTTPGLKFTFGVPAPQPSAPAAFSWKPAPTESPKTTEFVFGSPQKREFEFKPKSPRRVSEAREDGDAEEPVEEEEEEDTIYFKPAVPLPDKVEVRTGEEDEEVVHRDRAKLFRFADGEWKDRGVGDVKILREKAGGKLRVVMRREQVLKVCLNHRLTKDVEYRPKDEKTWLFHAADYSDGAVSNDQFCVRFKSAEAARAFKKAAEDAVRVGEDVPATDDSDVEFVSETKVSEEEEREAVRLGLPPKFFAYRQRPDCRCAQCLKEDEYLKELFMETKNAPNLEELLRQPPKTAFTFGAASKATFSFTPGQPIFGFSPKLNPFGDAAKTSNLFDSPKTTPKTSTIFGTTGTNIFDTTAPETTNGAATPKTSSLFGSTAANIFGSPPQTVNSATAPKTNTIFGTTATDSPASWNLFGTAGNDNSKSTATLDTTASTDNPETTNASSVFGGTAANIFGTAPQMVNSATAPKTSSIFGPTGTGSSKSTNIFDTTAPADNPESTNGTAAAKTTSVFGGTAANIFGTASQTINSVTTPKTSTESAKTTTNDAPAPAKPNIFADVGSKGGPFGALTGVGGSIFGSPTPAAFGGGKTDGPVLKCDAGLSFASLAARAGPEAPPAFAAPQDEKATPFAFLGAGAPVFGSAKKRDDEETTTAADEDGGGGDHDPHFEPIVPLPDQIVVTTGEEDETPLFNERAKLFRFDGDAAEWKERGVGQMKVLFHPRDKTYRLLLRREQVHKVVLNQRIAAETDLQPMATSDKAWIWVGYNYTDDAQGLEKLAVRFKSVELADKFKKAVEEAVAKVGEFQAAKPAEEEEDDDEEEEDDDDDDEDVERSVMFSKRCTLSEESSTTPGTWTKVAMGDLQVYYDTEIYAARIAVTDDQGVVYTNTLIGMNTIMETGKNESRWKAVEWADGVLRWRHLKATFSSPQAAEEFHSSYLEGLNYAEEIGLLDEMPNEHDREDQ